MRLTRRGSMNKLILETVAALAEISRRHYSQAMFPVAFFVVVVYLGERQRKLIKQEAELGESDEQ